MSGVHFLIDPLMELARDISYYLGALGQNRRLQVKIERLGCSPCSNRSFVALRSLPSHQTPLSHQGYSNALSKSA